MGDRKHRAARASSAGDREHRAARVSVLGTGRVEREPDIAHLTLAVEATRETAAEARGATAAALDAVIAAVRSAGVGEDDLRTASIDLAPAWDHSEGRPVRTGFTVSSRLGVAVRVLADIGRVIDAALDAGATGLDGVAFDVLDRRAADEEARRLAMQDARARAATIAAAAGAGLGRLVEVVEGGPAALPMARAMTAFGGDEFATVVLPGRVEVTVRLTATWELA